MISELEPTTAPPAPQTFMQFAGQYYVLANSVSADRENRVLKQGETFAIFDTYGDVQPLIHSESGIFHRGTRHLSHFEFSIFNNARPLLLNSTLRDDSGVLKVDLTNSDMTIPKAGFVSKGSLYFQRENFLLNAQCFEQITITNYADREVEVPCSYRIAADFADIFEVRGMKRARRGTLNAPKRRGNEIELSYLGLDGVVRKTLFQFSLEDFRFEKGSFLRFTVKVPARGKISFNAHVRFCDSDESQGETSFSDGLMQVQRDHQNGRMEFCEIKTSNEQFDLWLRRSMDDLIMMTTEASQGSNFPYAGIPWFCAPFGRDGIITALECLWVNPEIARGVLTFLADTQAHEFDARRDAAPGKIIHEVREGEMANLNEIPFGKYYGSVDATPLFVALAGLYLTRTEDLESIKKIWQALRMALQWLDRSGDIDGDGFIEYQRENPNGLVQQGWKDSHDSVFHADGSAAKGPIALCEVQGYAYMARIEGAKIARALGESAYASELIEKAVKLKNQFDEQFWIEDLSTYALALDGDKKPCRVSSSNAGQCLFTGIVKTERAAQLVRQLIRAESFCGWGVRTIASDVIRFNPMSYHNGSVWPHDVALIAWGMAKYGFKDEVERLFNGLFRAVQYMELLRMPEVFCGFPRREGESPTLYPNACAPQAWSAASVFMLLQAMIGVDIDAKTKRVSFHYPRLPDSIEKLKINGLKVDNSQIDLMIQNYHSDVSVQIARRSSGINVNVEK